MQETGEATDALDGQIVCGGTNNISKNESNKGLRQVTHFVQNKKNTNVIIMNAPHRFDLEESSCVNKEVKVFNRKLSKIMKRYNHIKVIDISAKTDHYTQHGLHMNKTGKEWITRKTADIINKLFTNSKPAPITLVWGEIDQEDSVKSNGETVKENTTLEINSGTLAATGLTQEETGNKPKQSTGMREKCGIQGEENEVDGGNTSQGSKDIDSTQNNADRHSEERLNHIEDEASGDNSDVKNDEDSVLLQTSYKTPVDTAVYPSSDSLDGKVSEEPNNLAFPSYP
jgi:RNase H-fold protein (predicted Holliday junction resolvase)